MLEHERCIQCRIRARRIGRFCRWCLSNHRDTRIVRSLQAARLRHGPVPTTFQKLPADPRVVVVDGREWWSIWDGFDSLRDTVVRHRRGVVFNEQLTAT